MRKISSGFTSLGHDEMISKCPGSLPENPITLEFNTEYLNSVNDYEGVAISERLPVTPPESDLDPNL